MDTGVQLGRRFRALKLWMIFRSMRGAEIRGHLSHIALARTLAEWIDRHPDFERLAPVPFSVVCFRWKPSGRTMSDRELDVANERLLDEVNQIGDVFSNTTIGGSRASHRDRPYEDARGARATRVGAAGRARGERSST